MELYFGDCLEIMDKMSNKSIDMILCDLPYGTTQNEWDKPIDLDRLWVQYKRIIKENGAICLFSQQPYSSKLISSNEKWFRYEWIWHKPNATGFLNANRMPLKSHENILVFYKKLPIYNPQKWQSKPYKRQKSEKYTKSYGKFEAKSAESKDGKRYPIDIIKFSHERGLHPTQKPVALLEYLIRTYTDEGDTVLDNCMGSGSTGVACINTGRKFIGVEKYKRYFDIAIKRIEEAEKQNGR